MAGIIDIPQGNAALPPNPTNPSGTNASQGYGEAIAGSLPALAPMLSGMARSANGPALPAFDPNAPAARPPADPNASPYANNVTAQRAAHARDQTIAQLAQPPGPTAALTNFFGGNKTTTDALAVQQKNADFYSDPNTLKYLSAHPDFLAAAQKDPSGFATRLQPVIEAAMQVPPSKAMHPGGLTKDVLDPQATQMAATIAGVDHHQAHLMQEPHQYTEQEFISELSKVPMAQAEKLWAMQHYLNPQQQLVGQYSSLLTNNVTSAAQKLAEAQATNNKAAIEAASKTHEAAKAAALGFLQKMTEGQNFLYPNTLGQQ